MTEIATNAAAAVLAVANFAVVRDDGLTNAEGKVADALVEAVNAFTDLPRQHPDEMRDFVDGIHRCQDQLALRIVRRHYPKGWPDKGGRA